MGECRALQVPNVNVELIYAEGGMKYLQILQRCLREEGLAQRLCMLVQAHCGGH